MPDLRLAAGGHGAIEYFAYRPRCIAVFARACVKANDFHMNLSFLRSYQIAIKSTPL
jgi:hypothetical protein